MTAAPAHFPYWTDDNGKAIRALDGSDASRQLRQYETCQALYNKGRKDWRSGKAGR